MAIVQIQFRRDTYTNWSGSNPILASGEPAYTTDLDTWKIGDGVTSYLSLADRNITDGFISGSSQLDGTTIDSLHLTAVSATGSFQGDGSQLTSVNSSVPAGVISGSSQLDGTTIDSLNLTNVSATGSFSASYIDFKPTVNGDTPAYKEGRVWYDNDEGALSVYNYEADITLQVGQEIYIRVYNNTGATILNGKPVFVSGSQGDNPYVWLAESDTSAHIDAVNHIIGMATHDIEASMVGYVTTEGRVRGIDTTQFAAGDVLYVSSSAGEITNIVPVYPDETLKIGVVIKSGANGIIFVRPSDPVNFGSISGLSGSASENGELWVYDSSKEVWYPSNENLSLSGSFSGSFFGDGSGLTGITSTPDAGTVSGSDQLTGSFEEIGTGIISGSRVAVEQLATKFKSGSVISALDVDWNDSLVYTKTLTTGSTMTFSNLYIGTKTLEVDGNFTLALPSDFKVITGTFDGTVPNFIEVQCTELVTGSGWITISQEAV